MATRPAVQATWTVNYRGTSTTFRLVMDNSPAGGEYTIETHTTDATGKASWSEFLAINNRTDDRTQTKMTAKTIVAMLDALLAV